VEDLKAVGYRFPKRNKRRPTAPAAVAADTAAEPGAAVGPLHTPAFWRRYDNIVLVINFNKAYPGYVLK